VYEHTLTNDKNKLFFIKKAKRQDNFDFGRFYQPAHNATKETSFNNKNISQAGDRLKNIQQCPTQFCNATRPFNCKKRVTTICNAIHFCYIRNSNIKN
jgi:hypothetical protein